MTVIEILTAARKILKDEIASGTFPNDSSSFFTDSEMLTWLNWAQREYQNKLVQAHEQWFVTATSINIIAGSEEYDMPCASLKIVRVEDIRDTSAPVEIYPITFNEKDKYSYFEQLSGANIGSIVNQYAMRGNKFVFRPRPTTSMNSAVRVYYVRRVDDLVTASDISDIPLEYHELLVWSVVENGMIKQEATAEAMATVLARRNRLVADLAITAEDRQVQRSRQVRRRKFNGR